GLVAFTRRCIQLRRRHWVLRRRRWLRGDDVVWLDPNGTPMSEEQWQTGFAKSLAVFLDGTRIPSRDREGKPIDDESFLLCFNAHWETVDFTLPEGAWRLVLDSDRPDEAEGGAPLDAGTRLPLLGRSLKVLARAT